MYSAGNSKGVLMEISGETDKLFKALADMQSELTAARKAKQGHGYKYADLVECIETAKEPLAKNGLAVTQLMGFYDKENTLITVLTHESGQYIGSEFIMEKATLHGGGGNNPAQQMGASITYMRRYAYAAIIGLAQEDNDAAEVRERKKIREAARKDKPEEPATEQQIKRLMVAYKGAIDEDRLLHASKIIDRHIDSFNQLSKNEAASIIERAERSGK